jgi:hypothetical protein
MSPMMRSWLAASLLTIGCASATEEQLRARAAYDLDCNQNSLRVVEIDERTRGVRGCGQKATYVESCDGPRDSVTTDCTWVLNSDSRRAKRRKNEE